MSKRIFEFHHDAGHGWLQVVRDDIPLFIMTEISGFSYQSDRFVYLEEDCDAQKFLKHLDPAQYEIKDIYTVHGQQSKIRDLPSFCMNRPSDYTTV